MTNPRLIFLFLNLLFKASAFAIRINSNIDPFPDNENQNYRFVVSLIYIISYLPLVALTLQLPLLLVLFY